MGDMLRSKKYILMEFIIIAMIIPTIILSYRLANYVIPILWIISIYALIVFNQYHKKEKILEILNFGAFTKYNVEKILVRWFFLTIVIYLITFYFYEDKLFSIQKQNPYFLLVILLVYPIFSALPQEFIFTTYFFSRYESIVPSKYQVIMSAIIFTYAHVLFINFIAPFLSIFGGIIFANTYKKTKSLSLVTFEHALYGNSLFFMGLGYYFWGGSVS